MSRKSWAMSAICALMLTSCVTDPAYVAFVKADRLRYEAIGSQWLDYVHADAGKSEAQKLDAARLLMAWEDDLTANEDRMPLR